MKVGILGGGNIGVALKYMLSKSFIDVVVADKYETDETVKVDVTDTTQLEDFVKSNDIIISCLPYNFNKNVAEKCVDFDKAYFDFTEDVDTTNYIKDISSNATKIMMPQCGLAPRSNKHHWSILCKSF